MINEDMFVLGDAPNKIREIFAYGLERKAAIGAESVFDLSIGNPSIPSPAVVDAEIARIASGSDGLIHGYTPSTGTPEARKAIANNLNERFGQHYGPDNLFLVAGAAMALASSFKAIARPGEEVIVIAPFFPEYKVWIESVGARCVVVNARETDFQIDVDAVAAAINERTAAVVINSPNNPTGAVYTRETLQTLADVLMEAREALGRMIYLVSDEPYRELVYGDASCPWVPDIYDGTIVCYSWSKSFSLPGERIGYVLVPDTMPEAERVYKAVCGAGRSLGHVCESALFQSVIAACVDAPVDTRAYDVNRKIFMEGLERIGYEFVKPQGAFYLWIKALEDDANAFCERAKEFELLLVPSDGFGMGGWVRAGYCCSEQTATDSLDAFQKLYDSYQ